MFIDVFDGPMPKRGDIVQSNVGNKRERTWMILRTHRVDRIIRKAGDLRPRFNVWMARWWELESDFRMRLYRSAERNGGQNVLFFWRYNNDPRGRKILEREDGRIRSEDEYP